MNKLLCNTFGKLKAGKQLTVGYFGGSITEGAGASDWSKTSWRALITAWLRKCYPQCDITEIQAAIGGTGSDLGAYRCETDLLSKNPDFVFVEFSVNDFGSDEVKISRYMDGIVRQIWNKNPQAEIAFVYTITREMAAAYEAGETPYTIVLHQKIAEYYGIPSVNVGIKLWQRVKNGEASWEELLTDTVHPTDKGYIIYADEIQKFLIEHLAEGNACRQLKAPFSPNPCEKGRLVDAWELQKEPWKKDSNSLSERYPRMLVCNTAGAELEYSFTGTSVGFYWLIAPDSGDIEWSIDGSEPKRSSSWDKYALSFTRANYCILGESMEYGQHTLRIKVLQEKQPQSEGNWIRIGAVLVE